jgi:phosphotransferase system HPr (HPr) family protein
MQTAELTIRNPSGLHARPAALFVRAAAQYASKISVENLDRGSPPVDAKSVLLVLTAGVQRGHRIRLTAEGPDEVAAIAGLRELVESGLGEPIDGTDEAPPETSEGRPEDEATTPTGA